MSNVTAINHPARRTRRDLPWLALGLAAAALLSCVVLAVQDKQALTQAWREWGNISGLRSMGISLGLLAAAASLATASGFAIAAALRACPAWLRKAAALGCKGAALFPFAAVVWAFIGFWLGHLGWPIESLMPAPAATPGVGNMMWQWLLPVLLLAAPLAAELAAYLLAQPRLRTEPELTSRGLNRTLVFYRHELPGLWRQSSGKIQRLALLGAGYLVFVEDVLGLPGAASSFAGTLRSGGEGAILAAVASWLVLAAGGCLLIWVLHQTFVGWMPAPVARRANHSAALIEGAIAIGLSRTAGWRRHVLPRQARTAVSMLLIAASWAVVWTMLISAIMGRGPGAALGGAGMIALDDYRAPLAAAAVPALWALSLWLLGRMVAPRSLSESHGRNPT